MRAATSFHSAAFYEMLTGRQPFQGDTIADVLAGVLAREPDLSALPTNLNPRITDLLRTVVSRKILSVAGMRPPISASRSKRSLRIPAA